MIIYSYYNYFFLKIMNFLYIFTFLSSFLHLYTNRDIITVDTNDDDYNYIDEEMFDNEIDDNPPRIQPPVLNFERNDFNVNSYTSNEIIRDYDNHFENGAEYSNHEDIRIEVIPDNFVPYYRIDTNEDYRTYYLNIDPSMTHSLDPMIFMNYNLKRYEVENFTPFLNGYMTRYQMLQLYRVHRTYPTVTDIFHDPNDEDLPRNASLKLKVQRFIYGNVPEMNQPFWFGPFSRRGLGVNFASVDQLLISNDIQRNFVNSAVLLSEGFYLLLSNI